MTQQTPHILGLTRKQLEGRLYTLGMPAFRAGQIWQWLYEKGIADPEGMTNLSKADREKITAAFDWRLPTVSAQQQAEDGVIKWLWKLHDGHEVESVLIPEETRATLCISSQVGCTLSCRFCHTGTQALARNLDTHEIVAQVWLARRQLHDFNGTNTGRILTNIVYMGMGEPLYNYPNVRDSALILMDDKGMGYGSRKITLSTSGVVDHIGAVGDELGVNLAISLHAADDETRTKIMPHNKRYPLADLMAAVKNFKLKEHRRITWEYVMLDGVNDTDAHAAALIKLIKGIPSLVNLIPFNLWPGSPFACSADARMEAFKTKLKKAGVDATLRKTRGEDILAACGQLRSESSKRNTVSLDYPTVVAVYGNEMQKTKINIMPLTVE